MVGANAQGYEGIGEQGAGPSHRGDALSDVVRKTDESGGDTADAQADTVEAKA